MNENRKKARGGGSEMFAAYQNSGEVFELLTAFENCTLPREKWTPSAYLTVVIWYLYLNPLPEARRLIANGIRRYNFEHNIPPAKQRDERATLTPARVRAVGDYLKQHRETGSFVELVNGLLRHFADERPRLNDRKLKFHPAYFKSARSNAI